MGQFDCFAWAEQLLKALEELSAIALSREVLFLAPVEPETGTLGAETSSLDSSWPGRPVASESWPCRVQ